MRRRRLSGREGDGLGGRAARVACGRLGGRLGGRVECGHLTGRPSGLAGGIRVLIIDKALLADATGRGESRA